MTIKTKSKLTAFALAFAIIATNTPVYAVYTYNSGEEAYEDVAYTYEDAAIDIYDTLQLIDENYYYRDEIDYRKIVDSALKAAFDELDEYSVYMDTDSYAAFNDYTVSNMAGIGVSFRVMNEYPKVQKVYKNSPAEKVGIQRGDIIMKINGEDVRGKPSDSVRGLIVGTPGTVVSVAVLRGDTGKSFDVTRGDFVIPFADTEDIKTLIPDAMSDTAYIEISSFVSNKTNTAADTYTQFAKLYENAKKSGATRLILDLRGNGGGDIAALDQIANVLVKRGTTYTMRDTDGNNVVKSSGGDAPNFKLAVLVDNDTASSAEILASAIKESGSGVIVGCTTYGKGVSQIVLPAISDDHYIKLTFSEIITRNGNKLNGVGVTPDVYVAPAPLITDVTFINETSKKEDIKALRRALNYLGYSVNASAEAFDTAVTDALLQFKTAKNVKSDEVCGLTMLKAINTEVYLKYLEEDLCLKKGYEVLR